MARSSARRCSATTREGRPCRQNPVLGSDPPLCPIHAGLGRLQEAPSDRRCTVTTHDGQRCRLWAIGDSDPPLCNLHIGRHWPPPEHRRCTAQLPGGDR